MRASSTRSEEPAAVSGFVDVTNRFFVRPRCTWRTASLGELLMECNTGWRRIEAAGEQTGAPDDGVPVPSTCCWLAGRWSPASTSGFFAAMGQFFTSTHLRPRTAEGTTPAETCMVGPHHSGLQYYRGRRPVLLAQNNTGSMRTSCRDSSCLLLVSFDTHQPLLGRAVV